ncbi:type IV secretory system conjugative DNA transfer family protein [Phaeobacter inhibens]|uniref:type IV secretory system conjugative DNA transfer family protein n=1 Tax=Phaeobacter inhibens TaxID=221822 RepID=UPI0021A4451C|nr:type IV secretory system conjugative DNA transfer family protein [Phaeobacter inhibens]
MTHSNILNWQRGVTLLVATTAATTFWPDIAMADLIWHNGRWVDERAVRHSNGLTLSEFMSLARLALMVGATLLGFMIGWLFSPAAKELRWLIFFVIASVAGFYVLLVDDILSWSIAVTVAICGFFWGIGYWLGRSLQGLMRPPSTFGSAKWADADHLEEKDLLNGDGIFLGRYDDGEFEHAITYGGDRHILTSAPTRGGKGVAHIITNLLSYEGSVLVIDPKSENLQITAQARMDMGQDVLAVDPWNIGASKVGLEPARINPLDWIKLSDIDAPENAMILAESLIKKNTHADAFWQEESKALLQGMILLVAFDDHYEGTRDLGTVRDLLLLTGDEQIELFTYMAGSVHALIASTGARFLQKDPKLISNVMASAQAETHFLDSVRVREALSASDFDFADLKTKGMSIYVILPADRLEAFSSFLRLIVQQAITINARNIEIKPEKPVLFILDEMPALGRLSTIEQAYGLMAGFGIQLWGITQDLCQLRRVYGQDYESFIANSGVVAYFGSPDKTSAEYFSGLCGDTTVWNFSTAISHAFSRASAGGSSSSESYTDTRAASQRKLAYPDELRRMPKDLQLLLIEDADPIIARKTRWFEDSAFKDKGVNTHKPKPELGDLPETE